jgi:hypothetical protein
VGLAESEAAGVAFVKVSVMLLLDVRLAVAPAPEHVTMYVYVPGTVSVMEYPIPPGAGVCVPRGPAHPSPGAPPLAMQDPPPPSCTFTG